MTLRVLVTGAGGFLGEALSVRYARLGHDVVSFTRSCANAETLRQAGVSTVLGGDLVVEHLIDKVGPCDVVVHCAGGGSVGRAQKAPVQDLQNSVGTLSAVLEYVRTGSPDAKVVFTSSAAVYGQAAELPTPETAPLSPVSVYGYHKVMAEQLCASYATNFGLALSVVRFFSVYGTGLRKQLLWDACEKLSNGGRSFFGTGLEQRDWVDVDDATSLMMLAADKANSGAVTTINGGSGATKSVSQAITLIAQALDIPHTPEFNGILDAANPSNYCADIGVAKSWGWQPDVAFEDGVAKYAKWYRDIRR